MSVQAARQQDSDALIEQLLALNDVAGRRHLVAQHPHVAWDEVVRVLTERVWQEVRVDTHRANRLADAALEVADILADAPSLARSLRAKANALYALDHHSEAIQLHERAINLFAQVGDDAELARTLSGSIQPLLLIGRYNDALAYGERARRIFERQGNTRRLARLEINIGNVYHRLDRFSEAVEFYQRAYDELLKHDDAGLAAVLSNLSPISASTTFPSLELHRMARNCEHKGMPIPVAYADYNIAYLISAGRWAAHQMLRTPLSVRRSQRTPTSKLLQS
jgi:tetratricopeptide (TPR) repeat protein